MCMAQSTAIYHPFQARSRSRSFRFWCSFPMWFSSIQWCLSLYTWGTVVGKIDFFSSNHLWSPVYSVEIIRFIHSMWINYDQEMFYENGDRSVPARAHTTTLNEELGQVCPRPLVGPPRPCKNRWSNSELLRASGAVRVQRQNRHTHP